MASMALAFDILARDKQASDALDRVGSKADNAAGKLAGLSAKGKVAFAGLATAAGAAGIAIGSALSDALGQGAAASKTAAAFGLDAETSARLGDAAGRLYADAYGESFGQVSGAIALVQQQLGRFDTPTAELEGMTANALDFAAAFDTDVNEAISAAGILMANGLVKDGTEAFDLLTIASQQLAPTMRDELLAATNEYSTFFAALGLTGEEAFTGMVRAAERGGNYGVDKFGDAMKELVDLGTEMSSSTADAFDVVGLDAKAMSKKLLAGGSVARGAMDEIVESLLSIEDPVKQADTALALFGTPLADLNKTEIPDFLEGMSDLTGGLGDVGGAAEAMGDTLNNNAATKIDSFKRTALQGLTNFIGGTVIPGIEGLVGAFGDNGLAGATEYLGGKFPALQGPLDTLTAWWDENGENLKTGFGNFATALGGIVTGGLDLISGWWSSNGETVIAGLKSIGDTINDPIIPALEVVLPQLVSLVDWAASSPPVLVAVASVITGKVVVAFAAWATAASAAALATLGAMGAAALALAPFVLVGIAVGVMAALFYKAYQNADQFGEDLEEIVGWLKQVWEWVLKAGRALDGFLSDVKTKLNFGESINDFVRGKLGLEEFATGGVVGGPIGAPRLVIAHGGETILPTHRPDFARTVERAGSSGPAIQIGEVHQYYPEPEPSSEGLLRVARKGAALMGG